ncbi:MAG: hypothetical protein ACAH17_03525 [Candidatus Paceibacterota bacterium]
MEFKDRKQKSMPIAIRDAQEGDIPFIFSSWLKSFRPGLVCRHVDNTIYYAEHHKVVEKILKRATCLVATDPADPATIYGYLVFERIDGILTIHYSYVKHTFRAMGVLRQLLKSFEHDWNNAGLFTHSTILGARLSLKYNLVYHPYILFNHLAAIQE